MRPEIKTPVQIAGFDAYWEGVPIEACPYDEARERGAALAWKHGWCVAHAEVEQMLKPERGPIVLYRVFPPVEEPPFELAEE